MFQSSREKSGTLSHSTGLMRRPYRFRTSKKNKNNDTLVYRKKRKKTPSQTARGVALLKLTRARSIVYVYWPPDVPFLSAGAGNSQHPSSFLIRFIFFISIFKKKKNVKYPLLGYLLHTASLRDFGWVTQHAVLFWPPLAVLTPHFSLRTITSQTRVKKEEDYLFP